MMLQPVPVFQDVGLVIATAVEITSEASLPFQLCRPVRLQQMILIGEPTVKSAFDKWATDLARHIASALVEFRPAADDEMEAFAMDCAPWNGGLYLAFLTHLESKNNPCLANASEMASWKLRVY
jgi:hypothetical protein